MNDKRNQFILIALACIGVSLLCYFNSLNGQFVNDDDIVVVNHALIKSIKTLPKVFVSGYWSDYHRIGLYRPIANVSFAFNYLVGGLNPWGYHLFNIIFNAFNGILITLLAFNYTKRQALAVCTALLFVAHPVHTEAVSSIANRTEILAAFFLFLTWYLYYISRTHRSYYWLSLLIYLIGLMAKESAVVFVPIVVMADAFEDWSEWRTNIKTYLKNYAGYIAAIGIYLIIRLLVLNELGVPAESIFFRKEEFFTRLCTMTIGFVKYYQLMLWPAHLTAEYDYSTIPRTTSINLNVIFSSLITLVVIIIGLLSLKRARIISFAILFFFISISIVANIITPTGILIAERVLYLPSLTVCLIAGVILDYLYHKNSALRITVIILMGLLIGASAARCYYRNFDWMDKRAYALGLVRTSPNNPKCHYALGLYYRSQNRLAEAEASFRNAIRLAPDKAILHGALGELLLAQNRDADAIKELTIAIGVSDSIGQNQLALARAYAKLHRDKEAVEAYRRAIELSPPDALLRRELAIQLFQMGNAAAAVNEMEYAIQFDPENGEMHVNYGLMLRSINRTDEALEQFQQAVTLNPKDFDAQYQLGTALLGKGRLVEAENSFREAINLNERSAEAHNNLGIVYAQMRRANDALIEFEKAVSINPQYANALQNLAQIKQELSPTTENR